MKLCLSFFKILSILSLITTLQIAALATTYYVSNAGDDSNDGLSSTTPWQTLDKVSNANIQPGDEILFRRGDEFIGQLKPTYSGQAGSLITFSAYGTGDQPVLNGSGGAGGDHLAAILINNEEYFRIADLEIQNERLVSRSGVSDEESFGIYVLNDGNTVMHHFELADLTVKNVFAITTQGVSFNSLKVAGIYFRSERNTVSGQEKHIKDVWLEDSYFTLIGKFGFWSQHAGGDAGVGNDSLNRNMNYVLRNNHFYQTGGSGITPGKTYNCLVENNLFDYPGSDVDARMAKRGSGAWFFSCRNVIAQYNQTFHARGDNDSYGMHIDFGNKYVLLQYNYSEDNQGFVEILGDNLYATYRFNISVNDGLRATKGNTFWFSDYAGGGGGIKSDSIFVYNNTVYVDQKPNGEFLKPGLQLTSQDALITNNAIYVRSGAHVGYKQFNRDNLVLVDNNLYHGDVRSSNFTDQDGNALFENPLYLNPGALNNPDAYKLEMGSPAIDAGKVLTEPLFPMAGKGIFANISANATEDYFGNAVDVTNSGFNIGAYNGSGETSQGNNPIPTGPQYEAETAALFGGIEITSCNGFSDGAAVKATSLGATQGTKFEYITAPGDGTYDLDVHYLTTANGSFTYQVNSETAVTENVSASGSFCYEGGSTAVATISVPLDSGWNAITFYDAPIIDYVELVLTTGGTYEAEDATLSGTATTASCATASGNQMVKLIDSGTANGLSFDNVYVPTAGDYLLTVDYFAVNSRTFTYQVNGGTAQTDTLDASGGWCFQGGSPGSHSLEVTLVAGYNTIFFYDSPIMDRISVGELAAGGIFEAEEAVLSGTAVTTSCNLFSGAESVKNLSGGSSNAVTFSVDLSLAGDYELSLSYTTTSSNTITVDVNGSVQTVNVAASGQWCYQGGSPADHTFAVSLNAGTNTIKVYDSPILDKIGIVPDSGGSLLAPNAMSGINAAIKEGDRNFKLKIFPNGVKRGQVANVLLDGPELDGESVTATVFDLSGRRVVAPFRVNGNRFELSTADIRQAGIYVLRLRIADRTLVKRLIVL
ncbi:T9SS type A sorting domain-containing protein [Flavilitoribacter nigricans]|uniref:CBM6 domain-containing protein n=1 Tax=Flavilitoribacter nigricans (strain ATCC 23147 / DSM 23189 / NBRC 102662 / NCIMB 1420 / SS-2) TaxID=1122177 RepID=A0A2D0NA33_FLAN2|nr:T9SS type A sorting domain-containing protein [Flavilitoribacter nigricans]PHN05381.1 hypothetical protein CRP01_17870 [Flavilitoribacter nigricans DSM 23189 = NBRC 102662]